MNQETFALRLKSARLKMGLSQTELANKIERTKQAISKYESGLMMPDSSVLLDLSKVLEQKIDYFFRPITISLDKVEFRKKAKLSQTAQERIKTTIQNKLECYLEIENVLDILCDLENPLQDLVISQATDLETAALLLGKAWDLGINPLPNVLELLEDKGIKVVEVDEDMDFDGLSAWVKNNVPVIAINKKFDAVRKRFTTLHELGHLLLNFSPNLDNKTIESYCHRFAAAMLMPQPAFLQAMQQRKRSQIYLPELFEIKEYYGISVQALMKRALDLDIIQKNTYITFCIKANQNKKEEGWGNYTSKEESGRFERLVYESLAEELISIGKAATLLNISIAQLQKQLA